MALDNETDLVKSAIELRQQAIERLKTKVSEKTPPVGTEATGRLVRDLEVYQIEIEVQNTELRRAQEELENQQVELEMQNEELVRVQEELELSRNTYSELYDFAPVGYFTFDAAGVIQNANLTGALLLGIERKRLINKPFSAFIADADSRSVFSAHLKAVAQGKGIQKCEVGLTGKDGTVICGQLQSVALRAAENKSGQFLSSLSDGTAAKQLGLEIQDAREYAENIVETVRKPLMVLDSDLKILTANHSFYDTFKVVPEDTIGNFIYDLGNRQWDIPQLRVLFKNILPNDTVLNGYEVDHNFPGIGRKIILLNARQIFREKVGSHIILLAMEDITDRKKAEEELLKAGALQRAIFNSANFSSIATDQNGVIQIFNVGAERMLGYNAAEVMNLITPADISDPQELIERAKALSAEL
ncbi:MAG: PAS domain S-box protein, partial [Desulfuromonadaceae bacterium]|nr:PAS domain S-box protein [Desulfuromonadaceae bacterium]